MRTRILSTALVAFFFMLISPSTFAQSDHDPNEPVAQHYEGGLSQLNADIKSRMVYPAMARKMRKQGTCVIHVRIAADGTTSQHKIVKNIGAGCGAEALRVVKTLKFKPTGYDRDYKVAVKFSLR